MARQVLVFWILSFVVAIVLVNVRGSSVGRPSLNSQSGSRPGSASLLPGNSKVIWNSPYTVRLPGNISPIKYDLRITPVLEPNPHFEPGTAPGIVVVTFEVKMDTNSVVLHERNLAIKQDGVKLKNIDKGTDVPIKSHELNNEHQTYSINTEATLMTGEKYELTIPFVASMVEKRVGLYSFGYPDLLGPKMRLGAASQFQPFHAREAFPCFDEPQFRSTFVVSIGRMEPYQSFSNTKINETIPCMTPGWVWDVYEPSPLMAPNLVNIVVVSGYGAEVADPALTPTTVVQIWAPQPLIDQKGGEYAATLTAKMVQHFQDYFDYPFMLSKLDSVLVWQTDGPAMEHWGSITYGLGGASLVYFNGSTPEWKRFNVASLVAHEVLHQWIGNLVACDWWSDIWVHEGFADYFADEAVASILPEFRSDSVFINSHFQRALKTDQGKRSHPVSHNFSMMKGQGTDEEGTTDAFDDIAYSKGSSLVRMMKNFLTEPVFKQGLRNFVKNNAYKPVTQKHVFEAFDAVAVGLPTTVSEIMKSWTLESGFPLVMVTIVDEKTISLTQTKFKGCGDMSSIEIQNWWVPIKVVSQASSEAPISWIPNVPMIPLTPVDTTKWLVVNPDATGYFRVMYDPILYGYIKLQLSTDHTVFSPITRSQILDDYFTFAEHKCAPLMQALELTSYLAKEKELVVWNVIFSHLRTAINMFNAHNEYDGLQKYLVPKIDAVLSSPEVNVVQGKEDKGIVVLLRMELLKYACMLRSSLCQKYVSELTTTWMADEDSNVFPLDLQPVLYCAAVAAGDKQMWDFYKKMHDRTPPSEQKIFLFKALSCSRDVSILKMFLDDSFLITSTYGPLDALEVTADNPVANGLVFETLKANYTKIRPGDLVRILDILSEHWVDPEHISDMETFIQTNKDYFQNFMEELQDEIESHRENAAWMQSTGKMMDVYFNSKSVI